MQQAGTATVSGLDNPLSLITPEVIRQYQEDGIVYLPQALAPEWLLLSRRGRRLRREAIWELVKKYALHGVVITATRLRPE